MNIVIEQLEDQKWSDDILTNMITLFGDDDNSVKGNAGRVLLKSIKANQKQMVDYFNESMKYKIMWALRSIEAEVENEKGAVTFKSNGHIINENFSLELSKKISELVKTVL